MNRAISYWGLHDLTRGEALIEEASRVRQARNARSRRPASTIGRVLRFRRNRS